MKVLLVTTKAAEPLLREVLRELSRRWGEYEFRLFVSKAPVAQLTTTERVAEELKAASKLLRGVDLIVLPGLIKGSGEVLERAFGVKTIKGTRYAGDLPELVEKLGEVDFSPEVPADDVMREVLEARLAEKVSKVLRSVNPVFSIKSYKFPKLPPPLHLLYEVGIDKITLRDLLKKADSLEVHGYSALILGCESSSCVETLPKYLEKVGRHLGNELILGVDLYSPRDLSRDVAGLSDLLLNVTEDDVDYIADKLGSEHAVVVIPNNVKNPPSILSSLRNAVSKLREVGVSKVIIDPLIRPPAVGLAESLKVFSYVRENLGEPMLFGAANIYELIDADSVGMAALLTTLAFELGATSLLVTESSVKTQGALREFSRAREMVYRAYVRKSPPINVGVDLLILKDKRIRDERCPEVPGDRITVVKSGRCPLRLDPKYFLKVYVDRNKYSLVVDVYSSKEGKLIRRFRGKEPTALARCVLSEFDLTREHAAYLGYELCKAELALKLHKTYVQDEPIFRE